MADEHEYAHHGHDDARHGHDHPHDDDHDHHHHHEEGPPSFADVVAWLAEQSLVALQDDGEHASVVFLGMPDGTVRAQRFDATGQHDVAEAWSRVATWAKGVGANAVYFAGEARRDVEDEPGAEEDVLVFAALGADGSEASFATPFGRDEDGNVTVGETEDADDHPIPFNEFRELWGLPLLGVEDEPGPGSNGHEPV